VLEIVYFCSASTNSPQDETNADKDTMHYLHL